LPQVAKLAAKNIQEKNLEKRLKSIDCDFFKEIPKGSDIYLFSNILHDWPDEKCETILTNCRKVLKSIGEILVIESIVPEGNIFSISKLLDLEVLLMGGGKERTENEYRDLLEQSGFRVSRIIPTRENVSIIEGIPA